MFVAMKLERWEGIEIVNGPPLSVKGPPGSVGVLYVFEDRASAEESYPEAELVEVVFAEAKGGDER